MIRPALFFTSEEGRTGEGRQDCVARKVYLGLDHEIHGLIEGLRGVVVETEDETSHDGDAPLVDAAHDVAVVPPRVEDLAGFGKRFFRERLEADEDAPAAALRSEVQKLFVPGKRR